MGKELERKTVLSGDRLYRYMLWREWEELLPAAAGFVNFIGLNPSTADETKDDPTIRRCIAFAKRWGFGALCMTNLFAWRETESERLKGVEKPVGEDNNHWLKTVAGEAGMVVAAWGTKGALNRRNVEVEWLITEVADLHCLRQTDQGWPEHPLYLPRELKPEVWRPRRVESGED